MRCAFTLLAAFLAFATACKKSGGSEAIAKMTELKDRMCACKDKACVDQVSSDMARWSSGHRGGEADKLSDEDQKKLTDLSGELTRCISQVARETADSSATARSAAGSGAPTGSAA